MLYSVPRFPTYAAAAWWPRYLGKVFALSFTAVARWPGDENGLESPRRVPLKGEKNTGLPEHKRLRPVSWRVRLGSTGSDCHHSTSAPTRTQENFVMLHAYYTPFGLHMQAILHSTHSYSLISSSSNFARTLSLIAFQAAQRKVVH
jgi:hypothetical protein